MSGGSDPKARSLVELVLETVSTAGRLVQGEIALFKAELRQAVSDAVKGVVILGAAFLVALLAIGWLSYAGFAALMALKLGPLWAALILTLVLGLVAAGLVWWGVQLLKTAPSLPGRSLDNLRQDLSAAGEGLSKASTAGEGDNAGRT